MNPFLSHVCDWGLCSDVVSPPEEVVEETGGVRLEIAKHEPGAPLVGLCASLTFL